MALVKLLKVGSNGIPRQHQSDADELNMLTGQFGDIKLAGQAITSETTNADITITPNGTGDLVLDGLNWPQADGAANEIISTDGAGQLSFVTAFAGIIKNAYTADEALAIRDVVYISAADNVSKADASAEGTGRVIGLAEAAAADTASVNVISEGIVTGFAGLTVGARYFLSETAGAITATFPSADEANIVQIGYAKSATELHLHIEQIAEIDTD